MRVTFSDPGVGFPIFRTLYLRSPKSSVNSSCALGAGGSGAGESGTGGSGACGDGSLAAKEGISSIGTAARKEFDGGEFLSPFPIHLA